MSMPVKSLATSVISAVKSNPVAAGLCLLGVAGLAFAFKRDRQMWRVIRKLDNALLVERNGLTFLAIRTAGTIKIAEGPLDPSRGGRPIPQC